MSKLSLPLSCRFLIGASTLVLVSAASTASATPLFENQGTVRAANAAHVNSSRNVSVDRRALQQPSLTFELDGQQVSAVRDRIERHKAGQTVWVGHIAGNPGDTVIITAHRSTFSGVIHNGSQTYELTADSNGSQVLNRIDTARLPLEDLEGIPDGGGLVGGALEDGAQAQGDIIQQDLLVVYTQQACNAVGSCAQMEANIATAVSDLNAAYASSGVDISMNLAGVALTNYNESGKSASAALNELRITNDGIMDDVHPLRDSLGADIVSLIYNGPGCGIGYSPSSPSSAFNVTLHSCLVGNRTMAHEIGHNQGALHDRDQHGQGTVGAYNYGFKRCNDGSDEDFGSPYFRTIMSYSCSGAPRVGRLSNPNVTYLGVPQGIDPDLEPARGAFNARTLNESAAYVAGFRDAPVSTPPAPPSGLGASATGFDAINLNWTDNADNESSFSVERSLDGSNWSSIASLGVNTTSFNDSGLSANTTYSYRVQTVNSAGSSAFSNVANATTDALPSTIDDLSSSSSTNPGSVSGSHTATHTDNGSVQTITETSSGGPKRRRKQSYTHTWTFDVTGGAGGVVLNANAWVSGSEGANFAYSTDNGNSWNSMFTITGNGSSTTDSFAFPGGTSGAMLVRATDAAQTNGEGVDSLSVDSLIITSNTIPGSPPAAPTAMAVTGQSSSTVSLEFMDNATDEFGFEIWRNGSNPSSCNDGSVVGTAGANSGTGTVNYTDTSASPSTNYWYFAKSFNGAGDDGSCSNSAQAMTDSAPAMTASGNGYKVKGRQTVDVSWTGATSSNVDIRRDGVIVGSPASNASPFTDNIGTKGGGSYTYEVCEASTSTCAATFNIVF